MVVAPDVVRLVEGDAGEAAVAALPRMATSSPGILYYRFGVINELFWGHEWASRDCLSAKSGILPSCLILAR